MKLVFLVALFTFRRLSSLRSNYFNVLSAFLFSALAAFLYAQQNENYGVITASIIVFNNKFHSNKNNKIHSAGWLELNFIYRNFVLFQFFVFLLFSGFVLTLAACCWCSRSIVSSAGQPPKNEIINFLESQFQLRFFAVSFVGLWTFN